MRAIALLTLSLLALTGCDKLTGAADQQVANAEAIGFACRVSLKSPEDCMKENDAHSPSYILDGWKAADEDIKAGKLDPSMGGRKPSMTLSDTQAEEAAAAEAPSTETPAAEAAPAGAAAPAAGEPKAAAQPAGS